jgi:NitT/TauT family transport system substrate-binding protein
MSRNRLLKTLACGLVAMMAPLAALRAEDITFTTDFGFNGRHAYYYVALDKGFYSAEGLNVSIVRGQGSADSAKKVAAGNAQIGFADTGAVIMGRSNDDIPVKYVAIVYETAPHAIFAIDDGSIKTPADLQGKRIADSPFSEIPVLFGAYAKATGIDQSKVTWVKADGNTLPAMLATGRVEAIGQFIVGEPLIAAAVAPRKLVRFAYKDAGLNYYGSGIIASEDMIKSKPDAVRKFVAATVKGMEAAFADPAEAGQILNKYHKQIDPTVGAGETERVRELAVVPGQPLGAIDRARMEQTVKFIAEHHQMKRPVSAAETYVDGFAPK